MSLFHVWRAFSNSSFDCRTLAHALRNLDSIHLYHFVKPHPTSYSFLFHSNTSAFSHLLPLCFRALRLKMRIHQPAQPAAQANTFPESELMQFNFRLDSMPTVPFDMEKKVVLRRSANARVSLCCDRDCRACSTGTSIVTASSTLCVNR